MIVFNNIDSGLTEVYLGDDSISEVYIGDERVFPEGAPILNNKVLVTYTNGQTYEVECNSSTTLTSNEIMDGPNGKSYVYDAEIGNCTTALDYECFYNCTNLTSVTIPNSVISIGGCGFQGCKHLQSVEIPNSVTSLGTYVFSGCTYLNSVVLGDGITSIPYQGFYKCSSLSSINIPTGVTIIDTAAFNGCSALSSITIPSSITSINGAPFQGCSSLTSVTLNSNAIASKTYSSGSDGMQWMFGTQVRNYILGGDVTSIGNYAFYGCSELRSVTIPSGVTSMGVASFSGCSLMMNMTIEATTPPTLGARALEGSTTYLKIYVPSESVEVYKAASGWSTYASKIQAIP